MIVNNPFLYITPRTKDLLIGRKEFLTKIKATVFESLKKKSIISINGEFGIGKSLFVEKVILSLKDMKDIKMYNFDFNFNLINELRNLPSEKKIKKQVVVIIDRFELILSLSEVLQHKILDLMTDLCKAEITLIITSSNNLLKSIKNISPSTKNYFKVLDVPALNFEEAKRLIISRLNEARPTSKDSLHPFTPEEIKKIFKTSKGNPRMILMLCAGLFEEKF